MAKPGIQLEAISNAAKHEQLERILQSQVLQGSDNLKAFLRFIVERTINGEVSQLKEYVIATEVFGRKHNYDPRIDSVVRVQAGRLRAKLYSYYEEEGKDDEIVINLPKGHYLPVFYHSSKVDSNVDTDTLKAAEPLPLAPVPLATSIAKLEHLEPPTAQGSKWPAIFLVCAVVLLLIVISFLMYSNRELRQQLQRNTTVTPAVETGFVWEAMINQSDDPPLLVLSCPTVYRFANNADPQSVLDRSIELPAAQTALLEKTPEFNEFLRLDRTRAIRLVPNNGMYTGMGEAVGLYRIADLFRTAGKSVVLKQSRLVNPSDLKYHNVIMLGAVYSNVWNEWSSKLPEVEDFVFTRGVTIENRNVQNSEQREYKGEFDEHTGALSTDYALITVRPNIQNQNAIMALAGLHSEGTEAAAEFVTTGAHLAELNRYLQKLDNPHFYQVLLKVGVENGVPTTITIVSLHKLTLPTN